MDSFVFADIFKFVDLAVASFITEKAATAASMVRSVSTSLGTLYVMVWGWLSYRGVIQEPIMDATVRLFKLAIIIWLATGSAMYAEYVSNFLYQWPTAFAATMQGSNAATPSQLLDQMLGKGNSLGVAAWEAAGYINPGGYLIAALIFVFTWIMTAMSAFLIIAAKNSQAILLAIGPVFILALLFDATKHWFGQWLSAIVTVGIAIVLIVMAGELLFRLLNSTFDAIAADAKTNSGIVSMKMLGPLMIYGIICLFTMLGMPPLAAAIGGSYGVGGVGQDAMGWTSRQFSRLFSSPRRALPREVQRLPNHSTGGSIANNPAYNQISRGG